MKQYVYLTALVLLVALTACTAPGPAATNNTTSPVFDNVTFNDTENDTETEIVRELNGSVDYTITGVEGRVITVPLSATDPDGDTVRYEYGEPFSDQGVWQTMLGDEGEYVVQVNATDGQATTTANILVDVQRANRAPRLECPDEFTFQEGELAALNCNVVDPEGDDVVLSYNGWSRSRTKRTDFDDAGEYSVQITARDTNNNTVQQTVPVIIENTNRAPELSGVRDRTVQETSTVAVVADATDPDGDNVDITYSAPLSDEGTWETTYGDAGEYDVVVTATDGDRVTKETFTLTVTERNRAPVIRPIDTLRVNESDTVRIPTEAYDPDGDNVEISYEGWMNQQTYTTNYEDAYREGCNTKGCTARYTVFVVATDGELTTREEVTIEVTDKNRPPRFTQ
jgi:hypothetical protein